MKVIAVNIGERRTIKWRGKDVETGIFKYPVEGHITLEAEDVVDDDVIDRKYHGGRDKACYIFSADHYDYFKKLYPELEFQPGMFGENITVEGLNESDMHLGDIYQLGDAKVAISQPREPCFKLGARFETQKILKQFINAPYPGAYLRIIEIGKVKAGDEMKLIQKGHSTANLAEVYRLLYHSTKDDVESIKSILEISELPEGLRKNLSKRLTLKKYTP